MAVRAVHIPQRMAVLLEVFMSGTPGRGFEQSPDAEGEEKDLDDQDRDGGIEGEALEVDVSGRFAVGGVVMVGLTVF